MSWLSSLTGEAAIGLLLAGALLALVLWVSWRKPTLVFVIALALRSCFAQVAPGSRREVVTRGCW